MIPINLPSGNYLIVPVLDPCTDIELTQMKHGSFINYCGPMTEGYSIALPPGTYEIVGKGLCSEITDEEAVKVVESYSDQGLFCRDYSLGSPVYGLFAIESLNSLIQSHNQQPDRCVLVKQL